MTSAEKLILRGQHLLLRMMASPSEPALAAAHFVKLQADISPWLADYGAAMVGDVATEEAAGAGPVTGTTERVVAASPHLGAPYSGGEVAGDAYEAVAQDVYKRSSAQLRRRANGTPSYQGGDASGLPDGTDPLDLHDGTGPHNPRELYDCDPAAALAVPSTGTCGG